MNCSFGAPVEASPINASHSKEESNTMDKTSKPETKQVKKSPKGKTRSVAQKTGHDFKVEIHPHQTQLPNPIWFIPSSKPIVCISIIFNNAGSKNCNPTHPAIPTFLSTLIMKGAGQYDVYEFDNTMRDCGTTFQCELGLDNAYCTLWAPYSGYQQGLDLAILALTKPKLPSKFFKQIKKESEVALKESLKEPKVLIEEATNKHRFPDGHPYRSSLDKTIKDLQRISKKDIAKYLRYFAQDNAVVVVSGPADKEEEIVNFISTSLQKLPVLALKRPPYVVQPHTLTQDYHVEFDVPQTIIRGVLPAFAPNDPKFFAKRLAFEIVAGTGMYARIFEKIRKEKGLAYCVWGLIYPHDLDNSALFFMESRNETAKKAIDATRELIQTAQMNGVTQDEFEITKQAFLGGAVTRLISTDSFVAYVAHWRNLGFNIEKIQSISSSYKNLTLEEVNQACKEIFDPKKIYFITLGKKITPPTKEQQRKKD